MQENPISIKKPIATTSRLLNSYRISSERERSEIEHMHNEKVILEAIVAEFKNNNEEYLNIELASEESAKTILNNSNILLKFATASVIESLKRSPELCNFLLNDISNNTDTTSYGSNCLSLMLPVQHHNYLMIAILL